MVELDAYDPNDTYEDATPADLLESVETNTWIAEAYFSRGADTLARECLRAAWQEYRRCPVLLNAYAGKVVGDRLKAMIVNRAPDILEPKP